MEIDIYCDGSCDCKSKLGGIGVYINDGTNEYYISAGYRDTTISRMEGIALLLAIESLSPDTPIIANVYSDSEYIVKAFNENRLTKWEMIGWNNIKNINMWRSILEAIEAKPLLKLKFHHIKGHSKLISNDHILGNAIADALANYKNHKTYNSDKSCLKR
jgi:ribonuclease HI